MGVDGWAPFWAVVQVTLLHGPEVLQDGVEAHSPHYLPAIAGEALEASSLELLFPKVDFRAVVLKDEDKKELEKYLSL